MGEKDKLAPQISSPKRETTQMAADLHHARVSTDLPEALLQRLRLSLCLNLFHFSFFM